MTASQPDANARKMKRIIFEVPGEPIGKARARTFVHRQSGRVVSMTPAKTKEYEYEVAKCFLTQVPPMMHPIHGALSVSMIAYFHCPEYIVRGAKTNLESWPCPKRPDGDNVAKSILDALNKIAWNDDAQVSDLTVRKRYSTRPRVEVTIEFDALAETIRRA